MAALLDPLTESLHTASIVSTGMLLVWTMLFLFQYLFFRHRRALAKAADEESRVTLLETQTELVDVRRERTMNRLENHILREFVSQSEIDRSISLVTRRYVPNQRDGFCVLIQFLENNEAVIHARGLSNESQTNLRIEASVRQKLLSEREMYLERSEIAGSGILKSFSHDDRRKADRLFLIANSDDTELSFALMTTALYPVGAARSQQAELAKRLVSGISRSLLQTQSFQRQKDELRATNERMTLRSIADRNFESPSEMMHEFLSALLKMVQTDRIAFFLTQPESELERTALCRCGIDLQPGARVRWQLHEQRIVEVSSSDSSVREYDRRQLAQFGVGTLIGRAMIAPVQRERSTTAHICCTRSRAEEFTSSARDLLSWASGHLAETIQRWLSFVSVERQAKRDGLTDLANRREFDERIAHDLQRAVDLGGSCSLVLFDLDHFKVVNDTYGHQAGDYVLKTCAQVITDCLTNTRGADHVLVARYGGEEVAVLLPDIPERGAARIAESIRSAIEQTRFNFNDAEIPVTVSAGVATSHADSMSVNELIGATDAALYASKELGRNRIVCATELTMRMD